MPTAEQLQAYLDAFLAAGSAALADELTWPLPNLPFIWSED